VFIQSTIFWKFFIATKCNYAIMATNCNIVKLFQGRMGTLVCANHTAHHQARAKHLVKLSLLLFLSEEENGFFAFMA
jgi:hypothetical protein